MKAFTPPKIIERFIGACYGQTGTEKTRSIRTFPSPLIIDFEDRLSSLHGEAVKVIRPDSYAELLSMLGDPERYVKEGMAKGAWPDAAFETLVIDSLTEGQYYGLRDTENVFGRTMEAASISDKTLRHYGLASLRVRVIFRTALETARRLNKHVFFICHEKIDKDDLSGRITVGPDLYGNCASELMHLVDHVFRYEGTIKDGKPCNQICSKNVGVYQGKDATNSLDKYEPCDFRVWWRKIQSTGATNA